MLAPSEKVKVMNTIFGKGRGQASTTTKSIFFELKIVEMEWTTVQDGKPEEKPEKSESDSVKSSGSDSDSDSKNSDDSALGKRARVRHDSSDSDISIDAEEQADKKMNRE